MKIGHLFCAFFFTIGVAVAGLVDGAGSGAAAVVWVSGLERPTSAGFGDCFEHALSAIRIPSNTKPAIIAIFCWRDQDESVAPEWLLLVLWGNFLKFVIFHLRC